MREKKEDGMKNFLKRTAFAVVSAAVLLSGAGCGFRGGQEESGESVDETKLQLSVGNYDGGYKDEWLYAAKARFEEKYKDVSFGNGKTGVQIRIHTDTRYAGLTMSDYISNWNQHVILCENIDYYNLVNTNSVADITDVAETPLNEDLLTGETDPAAESESIEEKMNAGMSAFYKKNGSRYYGIPFYEASMDIVYDMDVFDDFGLYFCADGYGDEEGFAMNTSRRWVGQNGALLGTVKNMTIEQAKEAGLKLSNGPDGKEGTFDDGMPATYDDFFKLCERIDYFNMEPIIWPGDVAAYMNYLAYNFWSDYEGAEQMNLNYNFDGTATDLVDMGSYDAATGSFSTYSQKIDAGNGYLLNSQAGKYYAIRFIEKLCSDTKYYDERNCFNGVVNQSVSEDTFLTSALPGNRRIAMLVDGSWWQNEAANTFKEMAAQNDESYSAENRRFGIMALPKATADKVGEGYTRTQLTATLVCVNAHTTKDETVLKLAKQFVKFLHTDESLIEFNRITGSCKPYDYELSEEEYESLSAYGKQNYELHKNADILFSYSQNPINMADPNAFSASGDSFSVGVYTYLTTCFHNSNETAWSYFSRIVNENNETKWKNNYGSLLG